MSLFSLITCTLLKLYSNVTFLYFLLKFLVSLNIIKSSHPIIINFFRYFGRLIEPILYWIKSKIPPIKGFDISPILLCFGLEILIKLLS